MSRFRYDKNEAQEHDWARPDEHSYWRMYPPGARRRLSCCGSLRMPYRLGPRDRNSDSHHLLDRIDSLYKYALRLTRSEDDAEDLIQEMYLRALSAMTRSQRHDNIHGWLFTILRNLCLNHLRSSRHAIYISDKDMDQMNLRMPKETKQDPHLLFAQRAESEQIRRAIALLSPANQEILLLREYEELSYQQIAHILHCPLGTVMSRLARARSKLRAILLGWHVDVCHTGKVKARTAIRGMRAAATAAKAE